MQRDGGRKESNVMIGMVFSARWDYIVSLITQVATTMEFVTNMTNTVGEETVIQISEFDPWGGEGVPAELERCL